MEYAKLQLVHTRAASWRLASVHARGAAVCILGHCADQENGGRIIGADGLSNEDWKALAGIRIIDVSRAVDAGLCRWDGSDLVCSLYDTHGERALNVKRAQAEHGKKGGRPPKDNPKGFENDNPYGNPQSIPDHTIQSIPPTSPPDGVRGADRWPYEHPQPWAKCLREVVGTKLSANTWEGWKKLCVAEGGGDANAGAPRVAEIAKTVPAKDRWSDAVEDALAKAGKQAPLSAAIAKKIERITL